MKKIKLLSLFLAVLMLAGAVTLFASCGTEPGEIVASEEKVSVDLTGYALLYGDSQSDANFTGTVRAQFDALATRLASATGLSFRLQQASRKDIEPDAKEILIGDTDREESAKALKSIKGDGFVIQVLENKIVLVGTSNLYTVMAVDYFVQNYLTVEKTSKTLTMNAEVVANEMRSVELTNSNNKNEDIENAYTYVYKEGLGMLPNAYASLATDVSVPNYKEYPMIAADALAEKMAGIARLSQKHFPVGNDGTVNEKEVLIGKTGREESRTALAQISETQYIITVIGDRVVVNAWSNAVLSQATDAYLDIIKEATIKEEDGTVKVCLPVNFRLVAQADHEWVTDFPKPEAEGVQLYNTMDNNDNSLQYLYRGEGVNKEAYDAYCAQLKAAGYKEYMSNTIEGSIFKVFTHKGKNVALYVAYDAYTHKDEYDEYNWTISKQIDTKVLDPYAFEASLRIISSTIENAYLPEQKLLNKYSYDYVTDTTITSMPIYSKAVGHCYIVTLEDGSFIVYDGGGTNEGGAEYHTIMNVLRELNKQVTGKDTNSSNPIRITAWILSHAHWDHYAAYRKFLEIYGRSGELKMNYMIANIPSKEAYCSDDFSEVADVMTPDDIKKMQASVTGGFTYIKMHTGMKIYLANAEIETMVTWEDMNPYQVPNTNDTNTVLRMTYHSQNSSETTTMMWLGDANRNQSRFMCAMYGTYLKSDMSTVAHHGNAGCEIDLYEMIDPETLFWTHHTGAVYTYLNPANSTKTWNHQVDQYFAYQLESVKRIFTTGPQMFGSADTDAGKVAAGTLPPMDGYVQITFKDGKPDFDNVTELHFEYQKNNDGKWVTKNVTRTDLIHTDISGGAEAFTPNQNTMTFISNYMVKCDTACPTGEHTH